MDKVKSLAKRLLNHNGALEKRIDVLEKEVQECRQLNLRLAELTDVVAELLVPISDRDQARVDELLESYRKDVNTV